MPPSTSDFPSIGDTDGTQVLPWWVLAVAQRQPEDPVAEHRTDPLRRLLPCAIALLLATSCATPELILALKRDRNPEGPYREEVCASPAETGVGRWDCPPQRVAQLRREADAANRRQAAHRAANTCAPGRPDACATLIRRTFAAHGLDGNAAVRVATCESGLNPQATNGSHDGLFQQSRAYWPGRAATYGVAGRSAYDPVANVTVSAGMVRDTGGWSHWSCKP